MSRAAQGDAGDPVTDGAGPQAPAPAEPGVARRGAGGRRAGRPRWSSGGILPVAVPAWLLGLHAAIVTSTPYLGDDTINKSLRDVGMTLPGLIGKYTHQWMVNEGRFFPGSLAWSYSLFWYAGSRIEYKLILGLVTALAAVVIALLAGRLTGQRRLALVAVPVVVGLLQIRVGLDGLIAFAGLIPLTTALTLGAVLILCARRGVWWSLLAALCYGAALVTYETVLLFVPVLVLVVVLVRRSWRPAIALVVPAVIQAGVVLVLRSRLDHDPSVAYTVSLDPATVLRSFAEQALGAVPLSNVLVARPTGVLLTVSMIAIALVLAGLPTYAALRELGPIGRAERRSAPTLALLGLWMWFSSAGMVAITARWQEALAPGLAYIPVVYGYFGLALVLLALGVWLEAVTSKRGGLVQSVWAHAAPAAVALLVTGTVAGNLAIAAYLL